MEKSADAFRTISEVSDLLETPAHVLRFWESRFPQIKPVKRAGGRRYYRPSDVALLTGIKRLLHDEGMTIRGVQRILREQGVRHVAGLIDDPSPEEEALEAAMLARLDIEEAHPRTSLEIAADQARALEAAMEAAVVVPVAAVVVPFRQPEVELPLFSAASAEVPERLADESDDVVGNEAAVEAAATPDQPATMGAVDDETVPDAGDMGMSAREADAVPADDTVTRSLLPEVAPAAPAPQDPPVAKGPGLTLTSVVGATRREDVPVAPPAPQDAPDDMPPPLANRLRALPYTALAHHQQPARAALARLTALRNRLANPAAPPRN